MTNNSEDQAPANRGLFSTSGGSSSEAGGSGGSSCESHEERIRLTDEGHDDLTDSDDDGMNTIKRNIKLKEPIRPPRVIDGGSQSLEYYNLCHPEPPAPAIPRRAPYISHGAASHPPTTSTWTRSASVCDEVTRCDTAMSTLRSVSSMSKRKSISRRRKGGSSCSCKQTGGSTLAGGQQQEKQDSVLLLYSRHCTGSVEWARYLHKLFTELSRSKSRLTVRHLPVEDLTCHLPTSLESEMFNARLQLVIVSPLFLQWIYKNPAQLVGRLLQQDRVIALLLGVREEQVLPEHRSSLISFPQWVHLEARDHDLEFVQTVLYFSSQILQRTDHSRQQQAPESLSFTLFPRKVTESQNRVVVMLDKPLHARSTIRVVLEKSNGQRMSLDEVKLRNPFTLLVTLPVCLFSKSSLVNLYLEIDGEAKGFRQLKCESKTHELDSLLSTLCDPMEFLCQTLAISPYCKDQLDETLTQNLMTNIPKHGFPLLSFPDTMGVMSGGSRDHGELPTLLHFSSAHGLEKLTCALLDCPGARHALTIRNIHGATPTSLAKEGGFFDLVEILSAHEHNPSKFAHIYDFIKHGNATDSPRRVMSSMSRTTEYSGPDPYNPVNNYQIPPPPRPIPSTPTQNRGAHNPYLDMSGSNSGTPSPCLNRRQSINRNTRRSQPRDLNDLFETCQAVTNRGTITQTGTETISKPNLDSTYQEIASPKNIDPFGTFRASKSRRSFKEKSATSERVYVNDPFGTLRASRANSAPKSFSSEASTNDDVFTNNENEQTIRSDYRGNNSNSSNSDSLAVTNELLDLLEDFKKKSFSVKEMEILFENWRRKASLPENILKENNSNCDKKIKNDLLKTAKSAYSLLKMFKTTQSQQSENNPKINRTTSAKKFLKSNSIETAELSSHNTNQKMYNPTEGKTSESQEANDTVLDESQLSVVALPPTPYKADQDDTQSSSSPEENVSSQILPLHRLSGSSLPQPQGGVIVRSSHSKLAQQVLCRNKPVAEVSPFSNNKNENQPLLSPQLDDTYNGYQRVPNNSINVMNMSTMTPNMTSNMSTLTPTLTSQTPNNTMTVITESPRRQSSADVNTDTMNKDEVDNNTNNKSPVKEKIQKMRRSITEPLIQYFHDITMTSEHEEPDILNTPKSLIQPSDAGKKLSRKLFSHKEKSQEKEKEQLSLQRHAARTSQINEYQNISPTPSTDL